ncbi:metallophosphoesterase family protein [Mucilaginibacter sp.]|uniref:metallophosphoesterase family protein n=1 Tax=Mucilaginibacter sp. TaxID=1882438 RepID=UPI003D14509C
MSVNKLNICFKKSIYTSVFLLMVLSFICPLHTFGQRGKPSPVINMVYSSDAHYGISRKTFKGDTNVAAYRVNAAMIAQINTLPYLTWPADNGVKAGKRIGWVDYVVQTGDICNRMEIPIQSAAASWAQFDKDYIHGISLKGSNGKPARLLLAPGNHDISNAIGYAKPMVPLTDPTAMVKIYNLMLKPEHPLTNQGYNYATEKVNYSLNVKGIHLMFITLWPDSAERIWMQRDLETVNEKTPVIIFTHDQPTCEAKHFTNPLPPHNMTVQNKFQNLTAENYKEGLTADKGEDATAIEQRGWVKFLKAHPNIKAYFHGNSNYNQFYTYTGPDNDVKLNTFRVDSPMKGDVSSKDESKLSFQLISLDTKHQTLTVRECLWNAEPSVKTPKVIFGQSKTVSLKVEELPGAAFVSQHSFNKKQQHALL